MSVTSAAIAQVDLSSIRQNLQEIARRVGVDVYAVVKADAYGTGIERVVEAIGDLVAGFCVFSLREAADAQIWERTKKPSILFGPPDSLDPADFLAHHARPAVSNAHQARALRAANPLICVDTGMQRFACPLADLDEVIRVGEIREAFTHAAKLDHARRLVDLLGGRGMKLHAAASAMLDEPEARLDAVRPGLAIYRSAVRVTAPLLEVRPSAGPVGYTGFSATRHGVILCGYAAGLRKGSCVVNGHRRNIIEVGMQSAYVEVGDTDRAGDEVVLLGDGLEADEVGRCWGCTPHEALLRLSLAGQREYRA